MSDHEQIQEIAHINRRETENGIFPDGEYDIQVCSYDEEPSHLHIIKDGWDVSFTIEDGELLSLATDLLSFIGGEGYGSKFNDNGELFTKEDSNKTMSIKEIRKALQKIGFKQWQIKTTIHTNEVRVVILLADLAKNIQVVENKMLTLGWTKARISESTIVQGIKLRIMYFVPQHPISFLS